MTLEWQKRLPEVVGEMLVQLMQLRFRGLGLRDHYVGKLPVETSSI